MCEPGYQSGDGGACQGRDDEPTQYRPIALEICFAIVETTHHHLREVAEPQVEVRPGHPSWQFLVCDGGVEVRVQEFGSEHSRRSRSDHSSAQARAVGI